MVLIFFSSLVYIRFSKRIDEQSTQIDRKLESIAKLAAPYLENVQEQGNLSLKQTEGVPWRELFNSEQQSIEWFDPEGQLLATQGELKLSFPPQDGFLTIKRQPFPIRTFTYKIFLNQATTSLHSLPDGYIRISQSTEDLATVKEELFWQLVTGTLITLGLAGIGGFWLTQKAIAPVEQSYQQLQQFTADASHELRNPLTAIQASIEVMLNHPERIHPKDVKKLAAIASATEQMTGLTQDLLFLARNDLPSNGEVTLIEANNEIKNSRVFLPQVLDNLIDLLEPLAAEKEITLTYQKLADVTILGDQGQLSRLFANLLQNALYYTPVGGKVKLLLQKQNRSCHVTVEDTGIGIAPEQLPLIFDRFWRADKARSRRAGGTGLGLSIARAIAHRHGGGITVTSELGVGTCFKVSFPIA
jgi:signal transduction histidine kinase